MGWKRDSAPRWEGGPLRPGQRWVRRAARTEPQHDKGTNSAFSEEGWDGHVQGDLLAVAETQDVKKGRNTICS